MITQTATRTAPKAHAAVMMAAATGDTASLSSYIDQFGTPMSFGANTEIYGEGEPADYLYKVIGGAVRTCRILADGRRQIGSLFPPRGGVGPGAGAAHTPL